MKGCYDGDECIQRHVCKPGSCVVRERVEALSSREHEEAHTEVLHNVVRINQNTDEPTEIIPGEPTRILGNVEPETMSYQFFRHREDLSLTEEEIQGLRERFMDANDRARGMWIPSLPPQAVADYEAGQNAMTRHYPKHRCLLCWLISKLPGHHRCPHGRLVCEQCEVEASGW